VVCLLAAGCANHGPSLQANLNGTMIPSMLELRDTPFFPQEEYQCGPAALATVLAASGIAASPEVLTSKVYLPQRQGSLQLELIAASRRYGRLPYILDQNLSAIISELASGRPVLVMQNLGLANFPIWHYAVVIGFDATKDEIILRSGDRQRLTMSVRMFMHTWGLVENWALVLLSPGEMPATPDEGRYVSAIAALESTGKTELAARFYATALSRWPNNTLALFGTGNIQYAQGDRVASEVTYRRLLTLRPDHAAARNNYAYMLAERGCYQVALAEIDVGLAGIDRDDPMHKHLLETRYQIINKNAPEPATVTACPSVMSSV
jgi:tetratricopeptide (TPR) repeat protein